MTLMDEVPGRFDCLNSWHLGKRMKSNWRVLKMWSQFVNSGFLQKNFIPYMY